MNFKIIAASLLLAALSHASSSEQGWDLEEGVSQHLSEDHTSASVTRPPLAPPRKQTHSLPGCGVHGSSYKAGQGGVRNRIAGGEDSSSGRFPWHAALYRRLTNGSYGLDCGGTLIHPRLVISAAHCVWSVKYGRLNDAQDYVIALGKLYRSFDTVEDDSQVINVRRIFIPKRYQGKSTLHQFDIALLKLNRSAEMTNNVNVICMDWDKKLMYSQLVPGMPGEVAGYGLTSEGVVSETLQETSLPFTHADDCYEAVTGESRSYFTVDRFCAGYENRNISVCKGDSGGGLVFIDETTWKYYLQGIVSVSFAPSRTKEKCYSQTYGGFTQVATYIEYIQKRFDRQKAKLIPMKKTSSQIKCEEYARAVYQPVEPDNVNGSTCAMASLEHLTFRRYSRPMEFPHLAAISYNESSADRLAMIWDAVGSLISERYVLVTASTVYKHQLPARWVLLGEVDLSVATPNSHAQLIEVEEHIVHKSYKQRSTSDIGLLRLKHEVVFSAFVRPACLSRTTTVPDKAVAVVTGWGFKEVVNSKTLMSKKTSVRIVSSTRCSQEKITWTKKRLPDSMFCVVQADPGGSCYVDYGSPLQIQLSDPYCMYSLVGFASFGQKNCTGDKSLTVATSVAHFLPWIEKTVWGVAKDDSEEDDATEEDDDEDDGDEWL